MALTGAPTLRRKMHALSSSCSGVTGAPCFAPTCGTPQLAWIAFFLTFFATFAPGALMPIIRENLYLDKWQIGAAGAPILRAARAGTRRQQCAATLACGL